MSDYTKGMVVDGSFSSYRVGLTFLGETMHCVVHDERGEKEKKRKGKPPDGRTTTFFT